MRSRWIVATRLIGAPLAWLTLSAVLSPDLPATLKVLVGGIFAVALWHPGEGLLLAAGTAPLGALIAAAFEVSAFRLTEAIALAFLGGSLLRGWPAATDGPGLPRYATWAGWIFAAAVVASVAGLAWQLSIYPGAFALARRALVGSYFTTFTYLDPIGFVEGAKLVEGLGFAAATIVLFRRRPALAVQLPAVLAAAAICAALAALLVWRGLGPELVLTRNAQIVYRVAAHVGDVNAAGSYFVLILGLSLGMSARERGSRRAIWLIAAGVCATGIWLSASRTALAAAAVTIPAAIAWAATTSWRPAVRVAVLAILVIGIAAGGAVRMRMLERDPTYRGSGFRSQFAWTSARMIGARPLFGIGVGRYYRDSAMFLSPQLAWTYGIENAHNNFLQIASETGLVGFGLLVVLLAGGASVAVRALRAAPDDWRLLGAFAGMIGFLGTCLAGHPLLVTEVALPFWIQFGLVVALGSSTLLNRVGATGRLDAGVRSWARSTQATAAILLAALVLVSVPLRARQGPAEPPISQAVDGFYGWETGAGGVRFRWTQGYASVFAPGDVRRVEIPVRAPAEEHSRSEMGVEVSVDGRPRLRHIARDDWTTITVELSPPATLVGFNRINLKMDRTWRPAIVVPGSADMRSVAIQVGEVRNIHNQPLTTINAETAEHAEKSPHTLRSHESTKARRRTSGSFRVFVFSWLCLKL